MLAPFNDEYFMKRALLEAQLALEEGEVPVGAVVVCDNQIIARAHNLTENLNDVTAHAEMQAITAAADFLGGKYLKKCELITENVMYHSVQSFNVMNDPDIRFSFY